MCLRRKRELVVGKLEDYMAEKSQKRLLLMFVSVLAAAVTALIVGKANAAPGPGSGASFVVECSINGVFVADPIAHTLHEHVELGPVHSRMTLLPIVFENMEPHVLM